MHLSPMHIAVVVIVIILIFGAPKLPMLAKSIGQSLKIFKSEVKDLREDNEPTVTQPGELKNETTAQPPAAAPQTDTPAQSATETQDPQTHGK